VDEQHCQHIYEELKAQGVTAGIVHGKTPTAERDRTFINFKAGRLRALVNCMIATTGFDYPGIDLLALIRNTRSPVLYTQMGGRGLRTASGKQNCLWLDFTDTTVTLGPIDQIKGRNEPKKQDRTTGSTLRACPACQLLSSPTISYCQ
jgi:DNA repair protein RadD